MLALVCGMLAFGLMRGYAVRLAATRPDAGPPVSVVVAAAHITRGSTLSADDLRVEPMPTAFVPPGALTRDAQAVGRVAVSDVAEGEVLTRTRVSAAGVGPVASLVPPGLRAFVVPSGVPAGAIVSGDVIDVLVTFGGAHAHSETVATGLQVLSVIAPSAGSVAPGETGGESLVLLVRPDQAEGLAYATSFGDISVTVAGSEAAAPSPAAAAS